ncbi:MAG: hypothetical protein HRT87_09560 [Legionellales bacterium]|nr:hypothetical protein [Legionellales bacterium]
MLHQKERDKLAKAGLGLRKIFKKNSRLASLYDDILTDIKKVAKEYDVNLQSAEQNCRNEFEQDIKQDFSPDNSL